VFLQKLHQRLRKRRSDFMAGKDKACRKCKLLVKGSKCPICNGNDFSRSWKGVIFVKDPEGSEVAQLLEIKVPGRYCLWVK